MLQAILENQIHLEKRIHNKTQKRNKVNVLIIESTSNIAKVSLINSLIERDKFFNLFILSHDQSETSKHLYARLGANVILGGKLEDIVTEKEIDLLFLDNPHYHFDFAKPSHDFYAKLSSLIFENCLICYVPYAYISTSNPEVYTDFFHNYSWRYYLESHFHLLEVDYHNRNNPRLPNQVVTGHPYLDPYFTDKFDFNSAEFDRYHSFKKITWCPHHNPVFYGGISIEAQEKLLREYLEDNADVVIFFRPHPNLFGALRSKQHLESSEYKILLNEDLLKTFEDYWLKHPRIINAEKGPIYQHFKHSDLIIHNCGGYQMEAIASGSNIINLINPLILNKHVLQYENYQVFCNKPETLKPSISEMLSQKTSPKRRLTGMESTPLAGELIAKNLVDSLF